MNILGIRELTIDCIKTLDNENYFYGGGGTSHNIIWNLLDKDHKLYVGGCAGKDEFCENEINILNSKGINTSFIAYKKKKTKKVITEITKEDTKNTTICPSCKKDIWKSSSKYQVSIEDILKCDIDVVIFDSYKKENNELAKELQKNNILTILDFGVIGNLRYFSEEKIQEIAKNPYDIMQMNNKVYKFFCSRLNITDISKLYRFLNVDILIVTKAEECTIIKTENYLHEFKLDIKGNLDNNGAGDMHLATFIDLYIKNNFEIKDVFFEKLENELTTNISEIINNVGARVDYPYFQIVRNDDKCEVCGSTKGEKKIKRKRKYKIITALEQISKRIYNGVNQENLYKVKEMLNNVKAGEKLLVVGQGASYVSAKYISKIINECTKIYSTTSLISELD